MLLLLTAAAAFSVGFPLALLVLVATRSRLVPTLLTLGAICQVALVLSGWIAADVLARLASQALTVMTGSGDAEVLSLASELDWATGTLTRTALALVAPTIGLLAWTAFLRPSGDAAAYFADGDGVVITHSNSEQGHSLGAPQPSVRVATMAEQRPVALGDVTVARAPRSVIARAAGIGLAVLGALMAMVGAADGLRARVSYVQSQPAPGATVASGPAHQGTFSFGVNVPVPSNTANNIHTVNQRDAGARRRRQTLFGGLLLIVLGVLTPLFAPRRPR